ncbi:bacteriocin-like protein [Chryseobacterium taklimakanense]
MKNIKKLSRNSLKAIKGGNMESTCSKVCRNGWVATVTCSGSCSSSDGKWAGCNDGSNETAMCSS